MKNKKNIILNLVIVIICIAIVIVVITMLKKDTVEEVSNNSPNLVINDKAINMYVGDEHTLNYRYDDNGNNIKLDFKVSNKDVISLNGNKVKALSKGVSNITISYIYNGKEISYQIIFIVKEYDNEAPIIKVNGQLDANSWSNNDVKLMIDVEDKSDYKITYYIKNGDNVSSENKVIDNSIIVTSNGNNIIYIKAIDEYDNKSEEIVIVNIDKEKPTCSLKFKNDNIEITKNDNIGLTYYGTSNNYTGSNESKLKVKEGNIVYYVKDVAGNTNSCNIELVKKVVYRKSTCTKCNSCKEAGCNKYNPWVTTGTHCNSMNAAHDYIGEYEKYTNCVYSESCSSTVDTGNKERPDKHYLCTRAIRTCEEYKTSCDLCGCSSWSEYSDWTDKVIKEDKNTKVQKEERLYQK